MFVEIDCILFEAFLELLLHAELPVEQHHLYEESTRLSETRLARNTLNYLVNSLNYL